VIADNAAIERIVVAAAPQSMLPAWPCDKGADAVCQLGNDAGRIAAGEVVGAEVLVAGAVGEHVVGGGEERGGDSDHRLLAAAASLEAQELGLEVAILLAGGGPGALHEHRLQPGRALPHAGRAALAGTLVETWNQAGPGQEMAGCRELVHVGADLGDEDLAEVWLKPGISFNRSMASRKGRSAASIRASKAAIVASSCSMVFKCWSIRNR